MYVKLRHFNRENLYALYDMLCLFNLKNEKVSVSLSEMKCISDGQPVDGIPDKKFVQIHDCVNFKRANLSLWISLTKTEFVVDLIRAPHSSRQLYPCHSCVEILER